MHELNRRVTDAEEIATQNGKDIVMLQQILKETQTTNELISEVVDYARKTYEVFEPMAKFAGKVSKIGLPLILLWHGIKWLALKVGLVL